MIKRHAPDTPSRGNMRAPFTLDRVLEIRLDREGIGKVDVLRVEGHASVFDYEYEVFGGPPWGWIERIERVAFDKTLSEDPDVVFLRNHEGMPLARTKSGTLNLRVDHVGLLVRADLDLQNPEVQGLASALDRRDIDEMSFAFRVTEQNWAEHPDWEGDEMSLRKVLAVNLNRGDVSAVTFGASDATDIDIARSLDRLSADQLAEVRTAIDERLGVRVEVSGSLDAGIVESMIKEAVRQDGPAKVDRALVDLLRIPANPLL